MSLESDLNMTNDYYRDKDIALIYKKPTPIKIVDVKFDSAKNACITKAFFKLPSTTDYNGIYKGKYIDFEAKETNNKTAFPLNNIHSHQIMHIKRIIEHGGICFLIIRFKSIDKTYIYKGEDLIKFTETKIRKSIPIDDFIEKGYEIKLKYNPRLDYLNIINRVYGGILYGPQK
jgi:recombination protein U